MPRSRGFGPTQAARRRKSWEVGPGQVAETTSSVSANVILGSGSAATLEGLTLLRLRGMFTAQLRAFAAVGDGFSGAIGIGIVTAEAFAVGVTAVPLPITDVAWDGWIWWEPIQLKTHVALAAGEVGTKVVSTVDSKAMRKLRLGDTIFAIVEVTEVGTSIIAMQFDSRILVALP